MASNRSIEHPAQRHAIHHAALNAEAHDATRAVVHHDQHLVGPEGDRFASKHVETPQTVLRVAEQGEPGRSSRLGYRLIPPGENAPHESLVDRTSERQGDLLREPWTTPRSGFAVSCRRPPR